MSKMKKVLLMCTAYALVAALAIGGTIAYLQDDDSDVNVMTLGNVKIEQHEYQRALNEDGTYKTATIDDRTSYVLEAFEQGKPILPIVGDPSSTPGYSYAGYDDTTVRMSQVKSHGGMQVFAGKNAVDKFVTVENTGKTDAYVRTLVAVEIGTSDGSLVSWSARAAKTEDNQNGETPWTEYEVGQISIDGNNYAVLEFVYTGAMTSSGWKHEGGVLPAGATTYPSVCQFYIKPNATNEDMDAIDGNRNGTLDILVLSQAVQAAGFENAKSALDTGFGDVTAENAAKWFGGVAMDVPVVVSTSDELKAALANGGTVVLQNDISLDESVVILEGKDVVLDMNGKTITPASSSVDPLIDVKAGASLVIDGHGTFDLGSNYGMTMIFPRGDVTIKSGAFLRDAGGAVTDYGSFFLGIRNGLGKFVIEDGYFDGGWYAPGDCFNNSRTLLNGSTNQSIVVYGGTFVGQNPAWGDEGMAYVCPQCDHTSGYCQTVFLEGQTWTDTEIPAAYTIVEGRTSDGRPTYTVEYNK